ncbi:transmembrane protein, putative (macronuclear) [Tetrahymena thermophila SB210]|uniref:Transmembrane protein, putative n=1 Tax=Tetrahymena thermophila (strain SB210) TaxID=312017 RepID=Q24FG2_TETTS|nr:transmembrane protein, putative [Tetrahymena thermophila SB210]EAS06496.2 transmembrane protein, putative [Tetrahymena thermophila SB210]|eukprot:XP_001026741.2 transmembrane protein, putative [Tetrahymena thermophila SB210]
MGSYILFTIIEAQSADICQIGCINCQGSSNTQSSVQCSQCDYRFQLNNNRCKFLDCPTNTYLQRYTSSQNGQSYNSDTCQSICDATYYENTAQNTCDKQQTCSISYQSNLGNQSITNLGTIESIYQVNNNISIIIYPTFARLINTNSGQYLSDIIDTTILKVLYFQNVLLIFSTTNQVIKWDFDFNFKTSLIQIQQGSLSKKSQLFDLIDGQYAISSFDESQNIVYFTRIYLDNQPKIPDISVPSFKYIGCTLKVVSSFILCFGKDQQLITKRLIIAQQQLVIQDINQNPSCQNSIFSQNSIIQSIFLDFASYSQIIVLQQYIQQLIQVTFDKINQSFECKLTNLFDIPNKLRMVDLNNQQYMLAINFSSKLIFFDQDMKQLHSIDFSPNQASDIVFAKDQNSNYMTSYKLYTIQPASQQALIYRINISIQSTTMLKAIPILVGQAAYFIAYKNKTIYYDQIRTLYGNSQLFIVNSNLQSVNIITDEIQYLVTPFQQKQISHTNAIKQIIYSEDSLFLLTCSQDGYIMAWYTLTSLNPSFLYMVSQNGEECRNILIHQNSWVVALFSRSIVIFQLRNQYIKIVYPFANAASDTSQFIAQYTQSILLYYDSKFFLMSGSDLTQIAQGNYSGNKILQIYTVLETKIVIQNADNSLQLYQFDPKQQYQFSQINGMSYQSRFASFTYIQIDMISPSDFELIIGCINNAFIILNSSFKEQLVHQLTNGFPFNIKKYSDNNIYILFGFDINGTSKYFHYAVFRSINKGILYDSSFNLSFNLGLHPYVDYKSNTNIQYLCTLPISFATVILKGMFLTQSLGVSYGFFAYSYGGVISSYAIKDNGNIQYYGNQSGNLSFDSVDYQNYYQLQLSQNFIFGSVSQVLVSPFLEQIFVLHYQVDLYNIFTFQLQGQIKFDSQYDSEKVINLLYSEKNNFVIAFKSKQLIVINSKQINQPFKLNSVQQIQGVQLDEANKNFYIYGSSLRVYSFDLSYSSEITKEGFQSYQQCIITSNLIICKTNSSTVSIFNKKTQNLIASFDVINQPKTFKLFVDETNSQIFISTTFIQVYDFTGNLISQISNISQNIADLQLFGNTIAVLTLPSIFFYQRQTLAYIKSIKPFGGGNILGYYYISDYNTVAYYADEIRYGQVFYFNLVTQLDDGYTLGSYPELGIGSVTALFYDSFNSRLNYIDTVGILYSINFLNQRSFYNVINFLEFKSQTYKVNLAVDHTYNTLFVYNQNLILYFNFNDVQKSTIIQSAKAVQFFFKYQPPSSNDLSQTYYYVFDNNNILYSYKDFTQIYITYFVKQIRDVKQIDEYKIVIFIFDDQILIYTQDQISQQQISFNNYVAAINDPKVRRFLTNQLLLTYDYQIIHINYLFYLDGTNNWKKKVFNVGQSNEFFKNCISFGVKTQQKTLYSLDSGRLMLYDESTMTQQQILPQWQAQQNMQTNYIKYFTQTTKFAILGYLNNVITVISVADYSIVKQVDVSTLTKSTLNELSVIFADEQYSRVFISFMYQKLIFVLDLQTLSFLQYINFPNNQFNRITQNSNYIFAYSNSQVNIFQRATLKYISFIKKNNLINQILNFIIVDETKIIISMNTQIDIYMINKDSSISLIDSSPFINSEIISSYVQTTDSTILRIVGVSQNGIFEKRINIMVFSQQNSYYTPQNQLRYSCYSQISMIDRVNAQKQFQISYNVNNQNTDYRIITTFGQDIKQIDFIQDSTIKVIIAPDASNSKQILILKQNSLQSIQRNQVYIQNFTLQLDSNNQIYLFSNITQSVKWQNMAIKNQNITNAQILFSKLQDVTISNLVIDNIIYNQNYSESDNLSQWNETFILFQDCNNIYLDNITISSTNIWKRSLIFGFLRTNNVQINNLTIVNSNFYQIIAFQNGQNIQINKVNMKNNSNPQRLPYGLQAQQSSDYLKDNSEIFAISIVGYQNTLLQGITLQFNQNILFLKYINSYKSDSEQVILFNDKVQIQNCLITQTITNQDSSIVDSKQINQALISIQSTQIQLINFSFNLNQGNILIQNSKQIKIQDSFFQNNTSLDGGALQLNYISSTEIINSSFTQNQAIGSGGAIFMREVQSLTFDQKSIVSQNTAQIGGGVRIISSNINPTQSIANQSRVSQNTAQIYGKDIGIFPFRIIVNIEEQNLRKLQENKSQSLNEIKNSTDQIQQHKVFTLDRNLGSQNLSIQSFRSGDNLPLNIQFVDQYDQVVQFSIQKLKAQNYSSSVLQELNSFQIEITANDTILSQVTGQTFVNYNQFNENNKIFKFTSLQINAHPLSKRPFLIKATTNSFFESAQISVNVNIEFRQCQKGEIFKMVTQEIQICEICQSGFYSLTEPKDNSNESISCLKCPAQAASCQADKIVLKDGYWRENPFTDNILYCDKINQITTCKESDIESKQGCIQGYIGPLCQQCDFQGKLWSNRYSQSSLNQSCQECSQNQLIISFLIVITILLFLYFMVSIIMFINNFQFHSISTYIRYMQFLPLSASCMNDQSTYYIKSLINYIQLSSILFQSSVSSSNITSAIHSTSYIGTPSTQVFSNIHCLYPDYFFNKYGVAQVKILIESIYPVILLGFISLIFYILAKFKLLNIKLHHNYATLTIIFFSFQPGLITLLSNSLSCRKLGENKYVQINLLLSCDDSSYKLFSYIYIIPYLTILLILPFFVMKKLYNHRKNLDYCTTKYKLGYFYLDYKPNLYFWEFIRIYFKTFIAIFYILYEQNDQSFAYQVVSLILCLYLVMIYIYKPYLQKKVLKLDCASLLILIFNIVLQQLQIASQISQILILAYLLHFFFIAFVILVIIRLKLNKKQSGYVQIIKKFFQKFLPKYIFNFIFIQVKNHDQTLKRWILIKKQLNNLTRQQAEKTKQNCDNFISKKMSQSKTQSQLKNNSKQQLDSQYIVQSNTILKDNITPNQSQILNVGSPKLSNILNIQRSRFCNFNIEKGLILIKEIQESDQINHQIDIDLQSMQNSLDIQSSIQYDEMPKHQKQKNQLKEVDNVIFKQFSIADQNKNLIKMFEQN